MKRQLRHVLFLQTAAVLPQQVEKVQKFFAQTFSSVELVCAGSADDIPKERFECVITPTLPWLPQAFEKINGCEWVHFLSAGVEKIWNMPVDWSAMTLTKSSGIHGPQMSEFAIGALLYFAKGFDRFVEQSRVRQWQRFWLDELTEKTLMVLGGGTIGKMVGERARHFGMNVISVKRQPNIQDWADETYDFITARKHLGRVNALVVCVPLTNQTLGIIGHDVLAALAPSAVLIDISRGGVVQEDAVLELLDSGHLRGAALDVFETQPLPKDSRLWNRSDVLLTPHVSGTSPHYLARALRIFFENACAWQQGQPMQTPVDLNMRY